MPLRCLLFASDEGTAQAICQLLSDLGIEAEHCADAVQAVARVTTQVFNLVIVDWDDQPEAASLLNTAREKKAAERPLNLAIVGEDGSVPQALQAGANSILRKPIQAGQALSTLTTARDLLRSKLEPQPAPAVRAAAASASVSVTTEFSMPETRAPEKDAEAPEKPLHRGEFLQSGTTPGSHFVTDAAVQQHDHHHHVEASEIDPLTELEPMAASVQEEAVDDAPVRESEKPRGLSFYLKSRPAPAPLPPPEPAPEKPQLLSFSDAASFSGPTPAPITAAGAPQTEVATREAVAEHEKRTEAALFAHISGDTPEQAEPKQRRGFNKFLALGVVALIFVVAFLEAPPAMWRPQAKALFHRAVLAGHNWLNPQPVTTAPAPTSHENFGRAGDEYKLPVAENIPDASTDPSQIRVLPVVDPTIKPPKDASAQPPVDTTPKDNPDPAQSNPGQEVQNPQTPAQDGTATPAQSPTVQPGTEVQHEPAAAVPSSISDSPAQHGHPAASAAAVEQPRDPLVPLTQKASPARAISVTANNSIPSSLKSQMASSTPEASGNRPVESAMPSIEPVDLPEATARGLLVANPDPVYPENVRGQHGTVIVQVLIARDGTVTDVKFQQGSLAFARAAIDAVRQWKFKPYTMNTHPVSVKTVVSLNFKPTA